MRRLLCLALLAVAQGLHVVAAAESVRFSGEASRVEEVLALADERLSLMPAVAAWKWQHGAPVSDPARERVVISAAGTLAAPLGLEPAPVEQFFALEVRLAREEEIRLDAQWRTDGYHFSGRVPDLKQELRPHLDRLTHDLLRALYLSAPAFERANFAERYAAHAARLLASAGWSDAGRHELLADLAQIRLTPAAALGRIETSHVLRIGTTGDYAPFSAESHGELRGIDIELAQRLAGRLGAQPIFVRTSWPTLLEDLARERFDLAIGGISATPAREAAADVSIPYLSDGKTMIARCADSGRLDSLSAVDRPGVRVVVNPGGTNEAYVRARLRRARIILYPDNATIFGEIIAHRADVMITDAVEVELQTREHRELCRVFPGTLTHEDKVILMARDRALTARVDDWLRSALSAGLPERLLREQLSSGVRRSR